MKEHVLVVFPHPDDEAFGASGTIIQYTQQGIPVTYACGTLGEMGRNMGQPYFATRESLPDVRKKELKDACKVMGIKDLRMLGYRDKTMEFERVDDVAAHILQLIKEINPTLVITHYPDYAVHPDHDACGRATVKAVLQLPENERPKLYCQAITSDREEVLGQADVVHDVSNVIEQKLNTIKAHRSQTEHMMKTWEDKVDSREPKLLNWLSKESFWFYQGNVDLDK